jgi:hypothetical protein
MAIRWGNNMKRVAAAGDIALIIANAVVWGIPTAIYLLLVVYQFEQGSGSIFLVIIGPLPYGAGLAISTFGFIVLWRRGLLGVARVVGLISLLLGLPLAAWGVLMLGST